MPKALCVQSAVLLRGAGQKPSHSHACCQLIYICGGSASVTVGGRSYSAAAPCVVFISRLEQHSVSGSGDGYERCFFDIDLAAAAHRIGDKRLLSVFTDRAAGFCHVLPLADGHEYIDRLARRLCAEAKQRPPLYEDTSAALLQLLLIEIYRAAPSLFSGTDSGAHGIVSAVRAELEQSPQSDLSLQQIAARHHISPYYLSHSFKRITGYGVMQYLMLCRISLGKEKLCETDLGITEIAGQIGFSDANNFSRCFRREVGCSPSVYRKKHSKA